MAKNQISVRRSLTDEEVKFCVTYSGFGEKNATEAYRRGFPEECYNYDAERGRYQRNVEILDPGNVQARASRLLKQQHIIAFLQEMRGSRGDHARSAIADEALLGNGAAQLKAAERVLELESDLGFQEDVERFWEISASIGDEVVVPVPNGGEVIIPVKEMFPRFDDVLPPADALFKTLQSLDQYLWVRLGVDKGEADARNPRQWKYGDGYAEFGRG
jgi:hypothetical protein